MGAEPALLGSPHDIVRCMVTYADSWQPGTGSIIDAVGLRRKGRSDGFRAALIDTLDERSELCRRLSQLPERDRFILFLWYVKHLHVDDIAAAVGISRRQCFRRKAGAIRKLVELGETEKPHAIYS
jgi:hypothetical protein